MPTYELALLLKTLPRNELVTALKRTASHIFQEGGIIRNINNLGHSPTPYKIDNNHGKYTSAHYFIFELDCPTFSVKKLSQVYEADSDIVKSNFFLPVSPIVPDKCTLDIEHQPAPFRPEVKHMLRLAERRMRKNKLQPNIGLDFEPFPS